MKQFVKNSTGFVFILLIVLLEFNSSSCAPKADAPTETHNKSPAFTKSAVELKLNMRKLWSDHIIWTRNVILCLVDSLPGADQATNRLLKNQVSIGDAFKPYYGETAGNQLSVLLHEHIVITTEVIKAANTGNLPALEAANKKWYANSDEIAIFLNKLNPNWKSSHMQTMMHKHLEITNNEVVQRITNNYVTDVIAFDSLHDEILIMADMLTDGIVKQFPQKF